MTNFTGGHRIPQWPTWRQERPGSGDVAQVCNLKTRAYSAPTQASHAHAQTTSAMEPAQLEAVWAAGPGPACLESSGSSGGKSQVQGIAMDPHAALPALSPVEFEILELLAKEPADVIKPARGATGTPSTLSDTEMPSSLSGDALGWCAPGRGSTHLRGATFETPVAQSARPWPIKSSG